MTANRSVEKEARVPGWVPPALLVSAILLCRLLLPVLRESWGEKNLAFFLHQTVHVFFLIALVVLLLRTYGVQRAGGPGRAVFHLVAVVLAAFLFVSEPAPGEKLRILLYLPLGATLYRARTAGGKNAGIRCFLDLFLAVLVTVLLEELIKGFMPGAQYASGALEANSRFVLMGMLGGVLARNLDFDRPYFSRSGRRKRVYMGDAPLLDLHIFGKDIGRLSILLALLLLHSIIHSFYAGQDLVGEWAVRDDPDSAFRIGANGMVTCREAAGTDRVPAGMWSVEGNLLDGFFLSLSRREGIVGNPCPFLRPWFEKRNRFRLQGNTVVFDNDTDDRLWILNTILRRSSPDADALRWQRVD